MPDKSEKIKVKREKSGVFLRAGDRLIPLSAISMVDVSEIEGLRLIVYHGRLATTISGPDAIEAVMLLKPSALEGRRMRWLRHAWLVHNLIGHPLMQFFAFFRMHRTALRIHDATIPRPVV